MFGAVACRRPERSVEILHAIPGHQALLSVDEEGNDHALTAAFIASAWGNISIMKLLAGTHGNDLFIRSSCEEFTPLHAAAAHGALNAAQWIYARVTYDVHDTEYKRSPAMVAINCGRTEVARHLIGAGHEVNISGTSGENPLESAICYGDVDIINQIAENFRPVSEDGYEYPIDDYVEGTAFLGATKGLQCLLELLEDGIEDEEFGLHKRVLLQACAGGCEETVRLALELGANPVESMMAERLPSDCPGQRRHGPRGSHVGVYHVKSSPLAEACWAGNEDIVRLVVAERSLTRESLSGAEDGTPLAAAAAAGSMPIVRFLAEEVGAVATLPPGDQSNTALHAASRQGHGEVVRYLVERLGMEVDRPLSDGRTPLALARAAGHAQMESVLLSLGAQNVPIAADAAERAKEKAVKDAKALLWKGACTGAMQRSERHFLHCLT